ncbi:MAG TPA: hypothetical protein VJT75_00590 [Thermoleophilaceae bacterium]|nr:hypothetical protein [Thermoleophilaceae bacterium]
MRAGAVLAAVAFVLGLAGCGGDGGGFEKTVDAGPPPEPEESISAFAGRLASAVEAGEQGNCRELQTLSRTGAMRLNCNARAKRAFAGFKVTATARYGTGGIVEFEDAETKRPELPGGQRPSPEGARGVYTVAVDRRGRFAFTGPISPILPGPTIGTSARDTAGPARAVRHFLEAVKRSDCAGFYAVTFTPGLEREEACASKLGAYAPLAEQLEEGDVEPKLERLGGTADFTFFGLRTGDGYRTVVVLRTAPGEPQPYLVMGTLKGPS